MRVASQPIIFTDLDGSLLELETYSFDAAREALRLVRERSIPIVFCSSKTRSEQEFYQKEIGIREPFIVENGSAIFIPESYFSFEFSYHRSTPPYKVIELGCRVEEIRRELRRARKDLNLDFRGYSELSLDDLQAVTGLDRDSGLRAVSREYSETIIGNLVAEDIDRLNATLLEHGLSATRGSRFYTAASSDIDKGRAVTLITELFHKRFGSLVTIAVGDGANDELMLAAVDHPFLLQKPDGTWADVIAPRLKKIDSIGPVGWNRLICDFIYTGFLP